MPWLIVLGEKRAAEWVLDKQRMAFRAHVRAESLAVGDSVALYVTRSAFNNPTRDEAQIAAYGIVASRPAKRGVNVAGEWFPSSCRLEITDLLPLREGLPFRPLVSRLTFIRKKRSWGSYMRRTLVPIPNSDFLTIRGAFDSVAHRQAR